MSDQHLDPWDNGGETFEDSHEHIHHDDDDDDGDYMEEDSENEEDGDEEEYLGSSEPFLSLV